MTDNLIFKKKTKKPQNNVKKQSPGTYNYV